MNFFSQKNRILLKELIKTDFKLRYQGSFIGYLWSILKPLMMFTIMYLVFVRFLRFDDGTPHYAVGLLLAMIFWASLRRLPIWGCFPLFHVGISYVN